MLFKDHALPGIDGIARGGVPVAYLIHYGEATDPEDADYVGDILRRRIEW